MIVENSLTDIGKIGCKNRYLSQTGAVFKSAVANGGNTAGDSNFGQTAAAAEGGCANSGNSVGDGDFRKAAASVKCIGFNTGNSVGNLNGG